MKKTILCSLIMLLMVSCQKDNSQEEINGITKVQKQNWLTANLDSEFADSQKQVTAYLFSTAELEKLVNTPDVENVRFILGYESHTIQVEIKGVDKEGKTLGLVSSTILKDNSYDNNLSELNKLTINTTKKRSLLLNEHILLPDYAYTWIDAWQNKLSTVSDLEEVLSYEGARFRYYSLDAGVIKEMTSKGSTNVGMFFGINSKGKATTILINLDKNNAIKKTSLTSKTTEDVYDATSPCPPNGDPEEDE